MAYRKLDVLDVMHFNNNKWYSLENTNGEVHLPFKNVITGTTGIGYKSLQIEAENNSKVGDIFLNGSDITLNGGSNLLDFNDNGITLSVDQSVAEFGWLQINSNNTELVFSDYGGLPQNKIDLSNSGITISVTERDDTSIKINGKTQIDKLSAVTLSVSDGLSASTLVIKDNAYISGQTTTDFLSASTINVGIISAGTVVTRFVDSQGDFNLSISSGITGLNGLTVNSNGATLNRGTLMSPTISGTTVVGPTISGSNITAGRLLTNVINSEEELIISIDKAQTGLNMLRMNKDGLTLGNGTLMSTTVSASTIIGPTLSGTTVKGNTISGVNIAGIKTSGTTVVGPTISGSTIIGPTISGSTIKSSSVMYSPALSGTNISASTGVYGETVKGETVSGGTVRGTLVYAYGPENPTDTSYHFFLMKGKDAAIGFQFQKLSTGSVVPMLSGNSISEVRANAMYSYSYNNLSDERLKTFENDIDVNFEKLKSIPKKYFKWKNNDNKTEIGTSAQKIQEIYPEIVADDGSEDKFLSVDYAKLSIVALAAIDKLYDKINEQQKLIDELMKK